MEAQETQGRAGMWIQPETRNRLKAAVVRFQLETGQVQSYDSLIDWLLDKYQDDISDRSQAMRHETA